MNHREQAILTGALLDRNEILSRGEGHGLQRCLWRDALGGVVRLAGSRWLGRPLSGGDSGMNARAIRRLEEWGLVERLALGSGRVTTHVRILPPGVIAGEHLLGEQPATEAATDG